MSKITKYLLAILVVAVLVPSGASAQTAFPAQQYLGANFSISSNGFKTVPAMIEDSKKDQSTCASIARDLVKVWSTAQANALENAPHGGALHQQCVRDVAGQSAKLKFNFKPVSKTDLWKKRKHRCKSFCVFQVNGRDAAGRYSLKKVRLSKHRRVLVITTKTAVRVPGRWIKKGKPFGVGLGGCTNKLAQRYERINKIRFKLRAKYFAAGKPKSKGNTPGPSGTGNTLPPAPAPGTPPANSTPGTTTPPPTGGTTGPEGNGGCTDINGNPVPCPPAPRLSLRRFV